MAFIYHLGRALLCLALTFQGLYVMGFIKGDVFQRPMADGLKNFQKSTGFYHLIFTQLAENMKPVQQVVGGLIALAALNVLSTSKFIIKLNITGLILLTFLIGIPYKVLDKTVSPLDSTDKALFHLYANLALIGGLWYYHDTTAPSAVQSKKEKEE